MEDILSHVKYVFQNAPFGIVALDAKGIIIYTNPQFDSTVLSSEMSFIGRSAYQVISELIWDEGVIKNIKRLITTGKPFYIMVETLSSPKIKGAEFVNINGYQLHNIYILVIALESGSFKRESRYKKVIQSASDAIIIMRGGVITSCNPAFSNILKMPVEDIIGHRLAEFVEKGDEDTLLPLKQDHIKEFAARVNITTRKGRRILGGKFHSIEDRPGTAMAILRDVTEKVSLEERLVRQNQDMAIINLMSETLSSSLDLEEILQKTMGKLLEIMDIEMGWIYLLDDKRNLLRCVYYHGIPQDVVAQIDELEVGEGIAGSVAAIEETIIIENVSEDPRLTRLIVKELGMRSFVSIPLKSRTRLIGVMDIASYKPRKFSVEDKRLLATIGIHIGVAAENALLFQEVASTSEKLKNALKIIWDRNNELRNIVYTVSHDLKNPIIAINGFCNRLIKSAGSKLNEKELEHLKAIKQSGGHMERFVSNLLNLSAVDMLKIQSERFSIKDVLDDVVKQISSQLEKKRGRIVIENNLPAIESDKTRIMQVFSNLISNAIKYSHPDRNLLIHIGYESQGGVHVFYVKDNGIGIPAKHANSVFDTFFRTYEDIAEGTGLGLSIAKKAVNAMGGEIWLESKEGLGSVFYFSIPAEGPMLGESE
ncbi:MAG: GAF domain-containing protein [Deltaproteobacteria bacterium]|nr:GAF domain-containing protein [Deltaproteobacteria bacterium]